MKAVAYVTVGVWLSPLVAVYLFAGWDAVRTARFDNERFAKQKYASKLQASSGSHQANV